MKKKCIDRIQSSIKPEGDYIWDAEIGCLASSIMSTKQFERFELPVYKQVIDRIVKADKKIWHYQEAELVRFASYFQDFPKGHITFMVEMDNIYDAFKALPNASISGGLYVDILGYGTKQQNIDSCKRLIDIPGGNGLILTQNKMMSFQNDAIRENMLAVQEFALNYML